jgi:uncharacterized protein with HEPN domain
MTDRTPRLRDFLDHLLEAIARIERYVAPLDFDAFVADEMAQDAIIRNLEIIGEACRNMVRLDPGFAASHPDLPIRAAQEMRNVLAHGYFGVDLAVVWSTVKSDLPALAATAREVRNRLV